VDWLWFSSVGYLQVFWTSLAAEAAVFGGIFTATAIVLWLNGWVARRLARRRSTPPATVLGLQSPPGPLALLRDRLPWANMIAGSAALLAVFVAASEAGNWPTLLQYLYHVPYGSNDPLYGKDIGFYLFSLPAYVRIKNWMLLTLLLSTLFAGAIYWIHGDIEYGANNRSMSETAIAHGSALLGLFFAVKAASYVLDRYLLLYGDNGVVVGASYTDVHVQLPVLWFLIVASTVAAFASWPNFRLRTPWLPPTSLPPPSP